MKDSKSKEKVLVVIKGGVVQSIYLSNDNIEVDVLDYDNDCSRNSLDDETELEKRCYGLIAIL